MTIERRKEGIERDRVSQIILYLYCLIPQIILWTFFNPSKQINEWINLTTKNFNIWYNSKEFIIFSLLILVERLVYTTVWVFSKQFLLLYNKLNLSRFGYTSVDIVETFFYFNKICQVTGYLGFIYYTTPINTLLNLYNTITIFQFITSIQLLLLGIILNKAIYEAIGKEGVYYGCRLGYKIPWCTSFPFNVISNHPQYVGATCNCFGLILLFANNDAVKSGLFGCGIMQVIQYIYMAWAEDYL